LCLKQVLSIIYVDSEAATIADRERFEGAMQRAVLGFFANLIQYSSVRATLKSFDEGCFVKQLLPKALIQIGTCCSKDLKVYGSKYQDIVHRIVYICDEFFKEDSFNLFEDHP